MNIEKKSSNFEHIQKLEDDANIKAAVLAAANKILPEIAERYGLTTAEVNSIEKVIKEKLIACEHIRPKMLWDVATEGLLEALQHSPLRYADLDDVFRAGIEAEMQVHIN